MNIILLSGGSGKRLWPLSNDVRSKQFIKLLRDEDGNYESMLQRVYRQITEVCPEANITVATSKTQVDAINNQLGDKVSICVEPSRRDTFPAILLAVTYLHDELGIGVDEPVMVCPIDPYVDNSYYECVNMLDGIVKQDNANITLMGITPTYPSEKYGYIIPESGADVSQVAEFKEKPDVATAESYIKQNALWNAGVFAFKLGYLLDKGHSMIDFVDFTDLYSKYDTLHKISFDYAVLEKESSIQVVRYSGEWRDVGTWNMISEVMPENIKGLAVADEYCTNTHIVNELNIPIIAMGLKDMVIAASGDGILVSDKERSSHMKALVEEVSGDARFMEKSWGTLSIMDVQPGYKMIKLLVMAGEQVSRSCDDCAKVVLTVAAGKGEFILDGTETNAHVGDVVTITPECECVVSAKTDMEIIEMQIV